MDDLVSDGAIRIVFPNGATFAMRAKNSGVVLDKNLHPVFPEYALELTVHRAQELATAEALGTA